MEQRILIVDDNTDLASIMSMILAAEGFSVKVCDNLTSSAICIEEWSPQLIVLDVNLNGEDGRELCNRLKSDKSSNNIKVILMSGDETTLEHTELFGADGAISKPFDSSDLLEKIQECLQPSLRNTGSKI
ncbi:MAG TPA: response regulator [Chitinophagaceae bacterium]|jgi:DNA-binding response OmpR family regulator|nr:response regulator [Chitinophagaceae bacterium]